MSGNSSYDKSVEKACGMMPPYAVQCGSKQDDCRCAYHQGSRSPVPFLRASEFLCCSGLGVYAATTNPERGTSHWWSIPAFYCSSLYELRRHPVFQRLRIGPWALVWLDVCRDKGGDQWMNLPPRNKPSRSSLVSLRASLIVTHQGTT